MSILRKIIKTEFPFDWVDLDFYPNSEGNKIEIYLKDVKYKNDNLISLFNDLFGTLSNNILIYKSSWWDYTLDTWNINTDEYDYNTNDKAPSTIKYLNMLKENNIELGFGGSCSCTNFDEFLNVTLECVLNHTAPYSHIYYSIENNFFFYFHHTGSIGLFFKENNDAINRIIKKAQEKYLLEFYE